ncbi:hypothetical protein A5747_13565 [Mycobacterium sp. IS-836]|uniref:hypothetical protein n=1 Tax=Mycobacterium sp. IS-836 TaxID=1834160 RepID=UPI00096E1402|nr:hypothetical protein [Mycobacterium sp. IS-836]OMC55414.1 hypothetical protein A5747_13565 [Mycobacterium sp. IS-836]
MTGADGWIYSNHYRPFTRKWWQEWFRIPVRALRHWIERAARGYSQFDMWNGGDYLADVIAGTAYWHFVHNHGWPVRMTREEWLDILLEIHDGFSTRDEYDDLQIPDIAWDLLRENLNTIWD